MKIVARFEIPYYQILNETSQIVDDLPVFATDPEHLIRLYRLMILSRLFDAKAIALQRTGKLGTYPSMRGQEATFIGIGDALTSSDIFVPYYRDVATLIQRGVKLSEILLYWGGDERGNCFAARGENYPFSVPVGSQPLYAAGAATAIKIRREKKAVLTVCGDGGSSQGDFYEAMNVAGVWHLPMVFVVNNNQWAISVARSEQTAASTIAQKAIAAGFSGEQVDGNDVIAVRHRTAEALKKAREKGEPMLLEMINYRQSDHTTADDAKRYETSGVREHEWLKEPVSRLKLYLQITYGWTEKQENQLHADCGDMVEKAVAEYLATEAQQPVTMIDYLYEKLPKIYAAQRELLSKQGEKHG